MIGRPFSLRFDAVVLNATSPDNGLDDVEDPNLDLLLAH